MSVSGNCLPTQAQSGAGTITSVPIDLGDDDRFSISVTITGTLDTNLKLQARNTESEGWIDVAGSSQANAVAPGHIWSVVDASYRYVRFASTWFSGNGNITGNYIIKQMYVRGA